MCAVVCDAGSTGTRAYSFWLPAKPTSEGLRDMRYHMVGKVTPGISSFAGNEGSLTPDARGAVKVLKPLLEKAASVLVKEFNCSRSGVPIWVLASAGVRLLATNVQTALWEGLQKALVEPEVGLSFSAELVTRTISGEEEGLFALIGANFLTQLQQHKAPPSGVLDLGGSSTQISIPPPDDKPDPNVWRRWARWAAAEPHEIPRKFFVRSYLSFGMVKAREKVEAYAAAKPMQTYPCACPNFQRSGITSKGVGVDCRDLIKDTLNHEKQHCPNTELTSCLGGEEVPLSNHPTKKLQFWALSGFYFVTAFAHWVAANIAEVSEVTRDTFRIHWPNVTVAELEDVADVICGLDWEKLQSIYSEARSRDPESMSHTTPEQLPHRCFEMNYLTTLLSHVYGFGKTSRIFSFVEKINNQDVEWPVGAFVALYEGRGLVPPPEMPDVLNGGFGTVQQVLFVVGCTSVLYAALRVGRSICFSGTLPEFIGPEDAKLQKGYEKVKTFEPTTVGQREIVLADEDNLGL